MLSKLTMGRGRDAVRKREIVERIVSFGLQERRGDSINKDISIERASFYPMLSSRSLHRFLWTEGFWTGAKITVGRHQRIQLWLSLFDSSATMLEKEEEEERKIARARIFCTRSRERNAKRRGHDFSTVAPFRVNELIIVARINRENTGTH